jgi:hypothetical protein
MDEVITHTIQPGVIDLVESAVKKLGADNHPSAEMECRQEMRREVAKAAMSWVSRYDLIDILYDVLREAEDADHQGRREADNGNGKNLDLPF